MKLEIEKNSFGTDLLWIDNIPAFQFWKGGKVKDAITPSGWREYMKNKEKVDKFIRKQQAKIGIN